MRLTTSSALTYLAEGGAHVVYSIDEPPLPSPTEEAPSEADSYGPSTPPPSELSPGSVDPRALSLCRVLRLRKDVPATAPIAEDVQISINATRPKFPPATTLFEEQANIPAALLERLNDSLRAMEVAGTRPANRHGTYLRRGQRRVAVFEDMRARPGVDLLMVQLKPKWLVQSSDAPKSARRCRTCAVRSMRKAIQKPAIVFTKELQDEFCPLDLVLESNSGPATIADSLLRERDDLSAEAKADVLRRLVAFLSNCEAIRVLRGLQQDYVPKLKLSYGASVSARTLWAMTLRDCTLFIRVSWRAVDCNSDRHL